MWGYAIISFVSSEDLSKILLPGVSLETITPPTLPPLYLRRRRLLEPLDLGAPKALIVMTPSGFGKTLLGTEWAEETPNIVWHSSTEKDNIAIVLNRMVSALRRVYPGFAHWYDPTAVTITNLEETIKRVTKNISETGETVNFVLENLEKMPLSNAPFVQIWTDNLPVNVRTLSLRKNPPHLSYERAASLGVLHYFTAFDLAFDRDETIQLAELLNVEVPENLLQKMVTQMGGWPAAIRLILEILAKDPQQKDLKGLLTSGQISSELQERLPGLDLSQVKSIDALIDALSEQILPGPVARKKNSVLLTPAEKRVLVLLASQITLVEVANKSHLSLNTVKSHLKSIYRKLGADSRDSAVRIAREQSLL